MKALQYKKFARKICIAAALIFLSKAPVSLYAREAEPCIHFQNETLSSFDNLEEKTDMSTSHPFEDFVKNFSKYVEKKSRQLNQLFWILETTGSEDAAILQAEFSTEFKMLFNDKAVYEQLVSWDNDPSLTDPVLKRQLNVLLRSFKENQMDPQILQELSEKEAQLSYSYANFRPEFEGKPLSENEIRDLLKKETDPERRKKVWEASKEIGNHLAPQILEIVKLRNKGAQSLGYSDYFQMCLDLQEVNKEWLLKTFEDLSAKSDAAYTKVLKDIEKAQTEKYGVSSSELGPWAWSDPFSQEDPLDVHELDEIVKGLDFVAVSRNFFEKMGFDVKSIIKQSDLYEREGKNQHAFCINVDRKKDIRTLNNIKPAMRWLETVMHELGHAVYELGYDANLPWLLRDPPHMIPTEAMALICGRQAYSSAFLNEVLADAQEEKAEIAKAENSLKRRQLIFSRWVLVMTEFESSLYQNPDQDLNALWWNCVEKYQKVKAPQGRENCNDWASKYHIGLAPVYYFSYLLGEMFASSIHRKIFEMNQSRALNSEPAGKFLLEKLFAPGNKLRWDQLIEHTIDEPLSCDDWIEEFAKS